MKYIEEYSVFESKKSKDIQKELEDNYCEFYYRKENEEKRHAFGTLKPEFLEKVWSPSPNGEHKGTEFVVYWDIEKKGFRQFNRYSFIKLEYSTENLSDFLEKYPKLEKYVKVAKKNLKEDKEDKKEKED